MYTEVHYLLCVFLINLPGAPESSRTTSRAGLAPDHAHPTCEPVQVAPGRPSEVGQEGGADHAPPGQGGAAHAGRAPKGQRRHDAE